MSTGEDMEKREPLCTVDIATMKNSVELPQKIKNEITIWSNNFTSQYLSKGNKNTSLKRYLHSHVHCSIIHNSQDMETA